MRKHNVSAVAFLCACPVGLTAVELGDVTLGGYLDTQVVYADSSADDDPTLDFASRFKLQTSYDIGSDVTGTIHIAFSDDGSAELETGGIDWTLTDRVNLMMGQYINALGWEAVDAPDRYFISRSVLVAAGFYGAPTNIGVGVTFEPKESINLKLFLQDHVYGDGTKGASDAMALIADAAFDFEGYGSVNLEFAYDQENAAAFGGPVDSDLISFGFNASLTAVEGLIVATEAYLVDYDTANAAAWMIQVNYAFTDSISASARLALVEPNDDGADDDGGEVAFALLTHPTGDDNLAVNLEFARASFDDTSNTDKATYAFTMSVLAIIP